MSRSSPGWQKDAREVLNKPGSVRRPALPRSAVATITLGVPLPAPSSVLPGGSASSLDAACLDLLRVGFTLPAASPPPRWALAFRPRQDRGPHHFTLACAHPALPRHPPSAVYFLWHFPWGRPPWLLASTLLYGARTFLHPRRRFPAGGQRPRFGLPARLSLQFDCTGRAGRRSSAIACHASSPSRLTVRSLSTAWRGTSRANRPRERFPSPQGGEGMPCGRASAHDRTGNLPLRDDDGSRLPFVRAKRSGRSPQKAAGVS